MISTIRPKLIKTALAWLRSMASAACVLPFVMSPTSGFAQPQVWPNKTVRIVVPVAAGGTTDLVARTLADALTKNLGQAFIVDGKPGAAGAIGSMEVARAVADGYTLLLATSSSHSVAPALSKQLRYDPVADFTPIAHVADANNLILASMSSEAKDIKDLLAVARQSPGLLNFASSGKGSFGHLTFALLEKQAGIKLTHVPYKGTAAAIPDMIAGAVHLAADAIPSGLPHVKEGRLRALAVTGSRRSPLVPNIPTAAEAGVPGFSVVSWFGLYAPRGLPPQLTQRINEEVNKVLRAPDMTARFANLGIEPGAGSAAAFAAMVAADTDRWARLATELKIQID